MVTMKPLSRDSIGESCKTGEGSAKMFEKSKKLWDKFYEEEEVHCKDFGGHTASIMRKAKREHRTDLSSRSWDKYGYYKCWDELKVKLTRNVKDNVDRLHGDSISMEEFHEKYEKKLVPCLIDGLADDWKARTEWNLTRMRQEFGERRFKCGEDDDGYPIKVKLKHFVRYQNSDLEGGAKRDDSPLYIFDSHFDDDRVGKQLLEEYRVPHLFREDLFKLVGEKRRPPYRWILFGPTRSGSNVHIDPLGTSAWNTLIRGHKLWTLFPPSVAKSVVKGKEHVKWKYEDDEPIDWNANILPRILEKGGPELESQMIQFIQKPGETVFIPSDWWHGVLNLDTTIAVTQNFCSSGNFEVVWKQTRTGRKRMARTWRRELQTAYPHLAELSHHLDKQDGFDLDEEIELADKKKLEKKQKRKK
mmetsp:Transcript_4910/g.7432  ORF Transcript_4910/g.7432 Transcript_4910/m.7432 type:complete len:416 (-) Transcript_4910:1156-2403(-)